MITWIHVGVKEMGKKLLALSGSCRRNSNSEHLLDVFLDEFISVAPDSYVIKMVLIDGSRVIKEKSQETGSLKGLEFLQYPGGETAVSERVWDIRPCLGCDFCVSGKCVQQDSMEEIYGKLKSADILVLSSPVYFYGLPSHVKAIIDRCQLFYNKKYRRKEKWRQQPGTGILLVCGATSGKQLFDGISLCVRYWFDAIDFEFSGKVVVRGVDKPSAVKKQIKALDEVRELARSVAERL